LDAPQGALGQAPRLLCVCWRLRARATLALHAQAPAGDIHAVSYQRRKPQPDAIGERSVDILIVAISALAAALVVLAVAVMWVAARYDRASRELSRYDAAPNELPVAPNELPVAPNELPAAPPRVQGSPASTSTRFLRRARTRASARR